MSGAPYTSEELTTLSALLSAYRDAHPTLTRTEQLQRLLNGIAVICDLQLGPAKRLVGLSEAPNRSEEPIRTAELQALIDRLAALSLEDGLTGLWNRRYFDRRLEQEMLRSKRKLSACAVALVDVDHFKRINDTYGHSTGDQVLCEIANILRGALRATDDIAGRFGGEEFVVLLPDTDLRGGLVAAERLRRTLEAHRIVAGTEALQVTVSVGVASYDASCCQSSASDLIEAADGALYAAKKGGRNRVCTAQTSGCEDESTGITHAERDLLLR